MTREVSVAIQSAEELIKKFLDTKAAKSPFDVATLRIVLFKAKINISDVSINRILSRLKADQLVVRQNRSHWLAASAVQNEIDSRLKSRIMNLERRVKDLEEVPSLEARLTVIEKHLNFK